jgi:hypothetical protein
LDSFHDPDGALITSFGLRIIAAVDVDAAEVIQDVGDIGMLRSFGFLQKFQRLQTKRPGFGEAVCSASSDGAVVQTAGKFNVVAHAMRLNPVMCLASSLRERPERDVHVASAWHRQAAVRKGHAPGNWLR